MDTLPADLLQLIDKHTSYIEDILLLYSSNYNGPLKSNCWKNFLHQLNRKYDRFDYLFISESIEVYVLYDIVSKNDLIGCMHILDKYSIEENRNIFGLLRKSIQNNSLKIFKYLYSKFANVITKGYIKNLFINASYNYNREICDFLIPKFDWLTMIFQSVSNPVVSSADAEVVFMYYILTQDSKLLNTILSSFDSDLMTRVILAILNRDGNKKRDNYDWIYKITEHYKDISSIVLYILLDNLYIDVAIGLSNRMQLGSHQDVLLNYYRNIGKHTRKYPKVDILRFYYEKDLITKSQIIRIFGEILTLKKFLFIDVQTYKWLTEIVPLSATDISVIFDSLLLNYEMKYKQILLDILKDKELVVNKHHIDDLSSVVDYPSEIVVELLKRGSIVYDDLSELFQYNEDCFIYLDNQLNTEQRYKWITELIGRRGAEDHFFDYIFKHHPNLNYQKILEDIIEDYETADDIEEPENKHFELTLDIFRKHNIQLNYKRLFNVAAQCRHVHLAIMLNSKIDY